jgi:hypothetical protein
MQQDVAPQVPWIDGDFFIYPDGRRLARVRGAEEEPETPETPAAEGAPGEPGTRTEPESTEQEEVNWEERYKNLEGNHTKATQEAAQLREIFQALQDPEQQAEVLKAFGLTLGATQPGEEENDPLTSLEQRVAAREQADEQRSEQEQQQAAMADFNSHVDQLAGKDHKLSDNDRLLIYVKSTQGGFTPDSTEKAFNELVESRKAYDQEVINRYAESKKGPRPPIPGGTGATDVPNLDKRQDRVAWMVEEAQRRAEAEAEPTS